MLTLFQVYIFLFIFSQNFNRTVLAIAYERVTKVIAGSVVGPNGLGTSTFTTTLDGLWGDNNNNMFYADVDTCVIRQVSIITGYVYNFVGTGICGYNGDQMAASNTQIQAPKKIFTDTIGNLYFTEKYFVRRVSSSNVVKIVAGMYLNTAAVDGGPATSSGLNTPTSVWVDTYLNIYISDRYNHRIRKVTTSGIITTIAGNGNNGNTGNGGPATSATISSPVDIQGDNQGSLYILQTEGIRQVTVADGKIYLYRNTPMVSGFWVASDCIYIADTVHYEIVKMSPNATIPGETIAGTGTFSVVDPNEHRPLFVEIAWPTDVWVDSASNMYIADSNNRVIWRIVPGGGNSMSVYIGGSTFGGDGAAATTAIFNEPKGIWGDTNGNIFIMDSLNKRVRAVSPAGYIISSFSTGGLINGFGLYGDTNAFIYVTDYSKRVVLRYNSGGVSSRFAGQDNDPGCDPGANVASSSKLNYPTGIWIDSLSNVFVADSDCHVIRKIRSNDTVLTTYAGIRYTTGAVADSAPATSAALYYPSAIWGNSIGELFIGDANNLIRKITDTGIIYTLSGYGGSYGVQSIQPLAISGDWQGNLFIIETNNYLMSSFPSTAPGMVTSVAGVTSSVTGFGSQNFGEAKSLKIGRSFFLFVDSLSNIFYSDLVTGTVRKIYQINAPTGQPSSQPSRAPSRQPTSQPSSRPTDQPTRRPSGQPSRQPTRQPSGQPSSSPSFIVAKLASLSDGLVAYYPFSANAYDKTDNRNHGIPNGIYYVGDRHGRVTEAAKFDGADPQSFVELPGTMFNFFSNMSVSMWIKPAAAQPNYAAILDKSHIDLNNGNRVAGWSVLQNGAVTNDYFYEFFAPTGNNVGMSGATLVADVWSHLVITKSDTNRKIYVNGALMRNSAGVYKEILSNGQLPLMLGALNTGLTKPASAISNFWVGVMDDLYIFNRTITDAEVQNLFRDSPYDTPTGSPSSQPSRQPSVQPSGQPTCRPSNQPTRQPTSKPSGQPSRVPSSQPSRQPSSRPSSQPTRQPTSRPSGQPSSDPSSQPSRCPTAQPTGQPSRQPSSQPSRQPSSRPSGQPTMQPTSKPSGQPSSDPTSQPSRYPTAQPTVQPSRQPSSQPSRSPSNQPTADPTRQPSAQPTSQPSREPSSQPSRQPTGQPSADPTRQPSSQPTSRPSRQPTSRPSRQPSGQPSSQPSVLIDDMTSLQDGLVAYYPFSGSTLDKGGNRLHANPHSVTLGLDRFGRASEAVNFDGASSYLEIPGRKFNFIYNMSFSMWIRPSSGQFSGAVILDKSHYLGSNSAEIAAWGFRQDGSLLNQYSYVFVSDAEGRINMPGVQLIADTWSHVVVVKGGTTRRIYVNGALAVTHNYILSDITPNFAMPLLIGALNSFNTNPATGVNRFWAGKMDDLLIFNRTLTEAEILRLHDFNSPTSQPSSQPSRDPTAQPTRQPTSRPSSQPSSRPTGQPATRPSRQPSGQPSVQPSARPSGQPTSRPSSQPTRQPSGQPSNQPIAGPTGQPSSRPSGKPSTQPSRQPSSRPSSQPTSLPTYQPSSRPSGQPSGKPSRQPSSRPSGQPTSQPTTHPTRQPSGQPTRQPTARPTNQPTSQPSRKPSTCPSNQPISCPSRLPTTQPTSQPSVVIADLSSLHEGLVAYFPFSGSAKDVSGRRNHGVESGTSYGNDRYHRNGEAVYFDGASAYIEVPGEQFNFPVNMSISMWIKPTITQMTSACLLDKTRFDGGPASGWSLLQDGGATNNYTYGFSADLVGGGAETSPVAVSPGVWSHLLVVKSDAVRCIYINGVRVVRDVAVVKEILSNGDKPLVIGAMNDGYSNPASFLVVHWTGFMDDLMIFNRSLTETEIFGLYQDSPYDKPTSFPSSQPSRRPSSQPSTQPSRQPTTQPSSQPSVVIAGLSSLHEGLVAYFPFSGNAKDVSGRRNHGVEYGISYGIDRFNRNGEATNFDGTSGYIEVPGAQFNFQSNMSISLWIKPAITQIISACLLDKTHFDSGSASGWALLQDGASTNEYLYEFSPVQASLTGNVDSSAVTVDQDVWTHIVVVKSDTIRNIYVNGVNVVHDGSIYNEIISNGGLPLIIGAINSGYSDPASNLRDRWKGLMDDLMIFDRSLTEEEITTLYQDSPYERPTSSPSSQPSCEPSGQPSQQPVSSPSSQPSRQPTAKPSAQPSSRPTTVPTMQPTRQPTNQPTGRPTSKPSNQPSSSPTDVPSSQPSSQPTRQPVSLPTSQPSTQPSTSPTGRPSDQPASLPTAHPTIIPSTQPSSGPSSQPSNTPSSQPLTFPSSSPSIFPSLLPSSWPSSQPSLRPSSPPTGFPSVLPSAQPSVIPSNHPTGQPSTRPSSFPTGQPSQTPSALPTSQPSDHPTNFPSGRPSVQPTSQLTSSPISLPSELPTTQPSTHPSAQPFSCPSSQPSRRPTTQPSKGPSSQPSGHPSALPSQQPTTRPSSQPVGWPTRSPSSQPSSRPSIHLIRSSPPSSRAPVTSKPSVSLYPTRTTAPNTLPFSVSPANAHRFQGNLFLFGTVSRPPPQGSDATVVKDIQMGGNPASKEQQSFVLFGQRMKFLRNILLNETRNSGVVVELTSPSQIVLSHDSTSRSSAVVDDLNHDGFPDLIVGYPLSSTCLVYFSNPQDQLEGFTNLTVSFTIYGPAQSEFGWAVVGLGDINGDSYNDMIVSAKAMNTLYLLFGQSNYDFEGKEFVLFVENMSRTQGIKITGSVSCFNTGLSVGRAVDFNGDGFKDIVFSALSRTSQGIVFILFNNENHWDNDISVDDLSNNRTTDVFKIIFPAFSFAGLSLASIGDINSDGFEDIAIGSLPYKGGYQSQRTYLIYGKRGRERGGRRLEGEEGIGDGRNETLELSEMREGMDGITIIGGGFLVAGPGDLNGDGIADLLIVSYPHWQGESNSYLIHYPDDRMSSPPSPFPSSSPSSLPSSSPSSSPTLLMTTETPSNLPTISTPSPSIDLSQPFLSFSPTTTTKPTRSPTQTLPPKSIRPTRLPTVRPTLLPSSSAPTSEAPSLKTVTALPTVIQSSLVPSFRPTKMPISSEPTFPANDDSSIGYETIYCTDNTVTCQGSTTMNTQFIVQIEGKIHIHCGEQFRCIYLISPLENSEILIDDFDLQKDKIDLSLFPWIQEPGQISMSTNPLTILLSPTQKVIFESFTNFAFTESNFLFQPPDKKKKTNLLNEKVIQILLLSLLGLFFSVCLFFGGGTASDSLEDTIKKEADKRKKVHSRASSEQNQQSEEHREEDSDEFEEESLLSVIEEGPNPSLSLSSSAASYILDNNNNPGGNKFRDPMIWRSRKTAESEENRKIMRLNNLSSSSSSSSLSDDGLAILGIGTLDGDSDNENDSSFNDNDTHWEISDLGTEEMEEEEGKEEIEYYDEEEEDDEDSVYGEGIRFRGQLLSFATERGATARSRSRSRARSHARSFGSSSVGVPLLSSSSGSSHSPLHSSSDEKMSSSSSSSSASVNDLDKSSDEGLSLSHRQDTVSNYSYFSDQDI
jgi:hypothetical protein